MARLSKNEIKLIIQAYKLDKAGLERESELAAKLGHNAHCVVCTQQIKLITGFISDLSKLIV